MAFKFEEKTTTQKSVEQVAQVVQEVGENKSYMGPMRKLGVSMNSTFGPGNYTAFAPNDDDDPFSSARRSPAWKVGWHWGSSVSSSRIGTMKVGWQVIFEVFDDGDTRLVVAKVDGRSERREVTRFVQSVFRLL